MPHLAPHEKRAVALFKEHLLRAFPHAIERFQLFGSKARGDATKFSDVDVLIVLKHGDWHDRHAIVRLAASLFGETGVDLSPKVFTSKQINAMRRRGNVFLQQVEEEGIHL